VRLVATDYLRPAHILFPPRHGELLYCGDLHIGPYTAGPKGTRPYFVLALTRTVVVLRSQLLTGRYLVKKIWPYKEIRLRTTGANEKNAFSLAHSPPGGETELYLLQVLWAFLL
jgi:hypothetical protein